MRNLGPHEKEAIAQANLYVKQSYPSKNGLKIPEILMLFYAPKYTTEQTDFQNFWLYKYGVEYPQVMLRTLAQKGFLCIAPISSSLERFKTNELKEILSNLDLKVSGKKSDLITRILDNSDEQFLSKFVRARYYMLTPLGEEETKNNQYVFDLHKNQNSDYDVWSFNKLIQKHPNMSHNDIIWSDLNERSVSAMKNLSNGEFSEYINLREKMAKFLLNEDREYLQSLDLASEAVFYSVNCQCKKEYKLRMDTHLLTLKLSKSETDIEPSPIPKVEECIDLNLSTFSYLQDKLNYSTETLFQKINECLSHCPSSLSIISNNDISGLIVSSINGDETSVTQIYDQLTNIIVKHYNSSKKNNTINTYQKTNRSKKSGCYVATCVYGSYDCPQVWTLRRYRDNKLSSSVFGRLFIWLYYFFSPKIVYAFGNLNVFKKPIRNLLDRFVISLQKKGYSDKPYKDK